MILMLEDDAERLRRFRRVLRKERLLVGFRVWRDAERMIAEISTCLPGATLLSLDHDLEPDTDGRDPGDGLMVARYLGELTPCCPVIVHSSNRERAEWMSGEFELGGWDVHRVAPLGEDWIEHDWRITVRDLLGRSTGN